MIASRWLGGVRSETNPVVGESLNYNASSSEDREIITKLVRKTYRNNIERALIMNYEQWHNSNIDSDNLNCSKEDILKFAKVLEHKALTASMVTRYYQQEMVETINEIKKTTEEGNIYNPLFEKFSNSKIKKTCEKGTQTNISLTNCTVQSPEDNLQMQQTKKTLAIDSKLDNSNMMSNPCTTNNIGKYEQKFSDLEDLICMLTKSPNFSEENHNVQVPSPEIKPTKDSDSDIVRESNNDFGNQEERRNRSLEERIREFATKFSIDESDSNLDLQKDTNEPLSKKSPNLPTECASNNRPPSGGLNWKLEYAAQNTELKSTLARLSPTKKAVVRKKFKELFDDDEPQDLEISLTEATLSRKRTANLVVGVLTPYYSEGKISSRKLFRSLAKKITDDILLVTNTASLENVTDKVKAYFANGNVIYSKQDIVNARF